MKDKTKGLVAGVLIGALGVSGMVGAKSLTETIQVTYSNIKIFMDGEQLDPRDANGTQVEPFIYNGTTYLPVRAVGVPSSFHSSFAFCLVEKKPGAMAFTRMPTLEK